MDAELQKDMDDCHSWILPKGTIIHYQGIPYRLSSDIEILGNTPVPEKFVYPDNDVLRNFFEDL